MDAEESIINCDLCASEIEPDDALRTINNQTVCSDCVRFCERCEDIFSSEDEYNYVDDALWCVGCTENHANYCEGCNEYSQDGSVYIADRSGYYCSGCAEDAYYCEECDSYYFDGCNSCEPESKVIHDYSYRPDVIFHSTNKDDRLFFGIEIEVEARGYDTRTASSEWANRLEPMELAYLKNDGSLNCGFEIVTHPMTHDFIKNEADDLWHTLEVLRTSNEFKVKSWDTGTCGLHIHISRTGFNGGSHMHRFLKLVYNNERMYSILAGRESSRWAKFDDIISMEWTGERDELGLRVYKTTRSFRNKIENGRNSDRYSAINTQNRDTLEMRIFRGSINGDTVKAQLDLAHASVEYTRSLSVKQVLDGAMSEKQFMEYIHANDELYPHLIARVAKVFPQSVTL